MSAMDREFTGRFRTGLFDCCAEEDGCKTCCLTAFCPAVQYGLNVERLDKESGAWFAGDFASACGTFYGAQLLGQCFYVVSATMLHLIGGSPAGVLPPVLHIIPLMKARRAIRQKYQIQGSSTGDFCTVLWCGSCVLCQDHRQLKAPVPMAGGLGTVQGIALQPPSVEPASKNGYMNIPTNDNII